MVARLRIRFVTSNEGKVREANVVLQRYGLVAVPHPARKLELQSDRLEEVAKYAAQSLIGRVPEPFFVEDSGLFIYSLRGFPGPYSSYVYRTIGLEGVLKLMEGVGDRRAKFVAVAALCVGGEVRVFKGEVEGV
ncbi:MAG: non-canonical purine NTP pyrophosphatase, partial [Thermoprotei archaeon]